jgi:flavodoxin
VSDIAVIYYSATGHVHKLAEAVAQGAADAGAKALTAAHYQGFRVAQYASRLVARNSRPGTRTDGGSSDPLALDPFSPPHHSRFGAQAGVASP